MSQSNIWSTSVLPDTYASCFKCFISSVPTIDGLDYTQLTRILTFDESTTFFTISLSIIDNEIHEGDEDFFGQLTTSADPNLVILSLPSTTIIILDDEG